MILIVGLGNPGPKYSNTRHNIGFMAIDEIVSRHSSFSTHTKFNALLYESIISGEKIIAVKPMTYMNCSGKSLVQIKNFYKIPIDSIIVIHDDIDLALGNLKVKIGGGNGGHNGLKSLDSYIGVEYIRLRVGVGRPLLKEQVSNYVLAKLTTQELEIIDQLLVRISDNLEYIFKKDLEGFKKAIA
ncbi:Peptidyl-tRNA hydrolase [Rickettsiales bacterium Ac37b]|nr:Peptidyl-tRNA hydrolase [Rickettsiales bacterium Ac37b]